MNVSLLWRVWLGFNVWLFPTDEETDSREVDINSENQQFIDVFILFPHRNFFFFPWERFFTWSATSETANYSLMSGLKRKKMSER